VARGLCEVWEELQRGHVPRTKHAEVPSIERCQLWFAKAFGDRQNRRIDQADVGIRVLVAELSDAPVVLDVKVLHAVRAGINIVEQRNENAWMEALVNPVIHLDQDKCWDN
jgi:hypothetical protein